VAKELGSIEAELPHGRSFLAIASERLIRDFKMPENMHWVDPAERELKSEIEVLTKTVKVKYGAFVVGRSA
jgi:hypothetical protein